MHISLARFSLRIDSTQLEVVRVICNQSVYSCHIPGPISSYSLFKHCQILLDVFTSNTVHGEILEGENFGKPYR